MKSKKKDYLFFGTVILLVVAIIGVSYAYFKLQIEGTGKDIVMDTGDLRLRYTDGDTITLNNAFPGDTITKTVTVENIGTKDVSYSLYWSDLINTIERYELHVTLDCKSYTGYGTTSQTESGTCNSIYRAVPISDTSTSELIKNNLPIAVGVTHEYTITVTFDDKEYEQNYNKKKNFTGKVDVREYSSPSSVYCTYDGELTQGATYVNSIYTYTYNSYNNGWNVVLTDKTSTSPVTEAPCVSVNNVPVVSMRNMFYQSQAISIDLSDFNTSKVTDMALMFSESKASLLDLTSFDTSAVTTMYKMFSDSDATLIDVSSFDTSNVTTMDWMFNSVNVNSLDLTNFNTSKVTSMSYMFRDVKPEFLIISSFDTSNVTDMSGMFMSFESSKLDIGNFNTSNVSDMSYMFYLTKTQSLIGLEIFNTSNLYGVQYMFARSVIPSINVSNFNTSKVTNMEAMFNNSSTTELDLSNFDTSNVTNMRALFNNCPNLKTIYVSGKFVTNNVNIDSNMFFSTPNLVGGNGTVYDKSNVDKTYARIDTADTPGYFTSK